MSRMERHEPTYPVACCEQCFATFPEDETAPHAFRQSDCPLDRCSKRTVTVRSMEELNAIRRFGRPVGPPAGRPGLETPEPPALWGFSDTVEEI
jgi:hypothetical protein